jgi:hypothetical protein
MVTALPLKPLLVKNVPPRRSSLSFFVSSLLVPKHSISLCGKRFSLFIVTLHLPIMARAVAQNKLGRAHLLGWVPTLSSEGPFFDPLTTTASDLAQLLKSGKVSSVQILNEYYRQILKYNGYLKAVLQLASGAVEQARARDAERARGEVVGPLHGIPVLLKV